MSYSSRVLDYVRGGMSEADAYALVAAERRASEEVGTSREVNAYVEKSVATASVPEPVCFAADDNEQENAA